MLLMIARKIIGPSTLLCGTLDITAASSKRLPSTTTTTLCDLFFSKSSIKSRHVPFIPLYWSFLRRCLCRTTSKALLKSMMARSYFSPFATPCKKSSTNVSSCVSQERYALKLCWESVKAPLSGRPNLSVRTLSPSRMITYI